MSVPIYAEGMPSWYNLFFATLGTLALLQHIDTGRRRWLFWAGCCAGCSLLMKITGLYFVAAGLFYIAYREQILSAAGATKSRGYSVLIAVGLRRIRCTELRLPARLAHRLSTVCISRCRCWPSRCIWRGRNGPRAVARGEHASAYWRVSYRRTASVWPASWACFSCRTSRPGRSTIFIAACLCCRQRVWNTRPWHHRT